MTAVRYVRAMRLGSVLPGRARQGRAVLKFLTIAFVLSAAAAPTALAQSAAQPWLPFARPNPFITPLPAGVPVMGLAEQAANRAELRTFVDHGVKVEQRKWTFTMYTVMKNGDIYDTAGRIKDSGVAFVKPTGPITPLNEGIDRNDDLVGDGWPIASWMRADSGEGSLALFNPETGAYGEMIGVPRGRGSFSYDWGGFIPNVRMSNGMNLPATPWWGPTAFGAQIGGTYITDHEMRVAISNYQAGRYTEAYVPHLLAYEGYRHHPNQWYYPASKTDDMGTLVPEWGRGGNPDRLGHGLGLLRMGGIFRLDPSIDVQQKIIGDGTAYGNMLARIIARTWQKYGATMTDQTGAGFALAAENVLTTKGTADRNSVSYGGGAVGAYGQSWLRPMMYQIIDEGWVQWVETGRNLEVDTGAAAPVGTYRPGP